MAMILSFERLQQMARADLEENLKKYENKIIKVYHDALVEIQGQMKLLYDKYAVEGRLSMADMARYNRYAAMEKQIMETSDAAVRKAMLEIKHLLPEQYNEAYYHYAWAIDNATGLRLNWGVINPNSVAKLFSLDKPENIYYANALHNYLPDARKIIRSALIADLSVGKSFDSMANQLKKALNITAKKGIMIARTEGMTALNAGTEYAYSVAEKKGIQGEQVWDATLDMRTRPDHAAMDQAVKQDDGTWLLNDGTKTLGPGNFSAPYPGFEGLPANERINCRCHLRYEIKGFSPVLRRAREKGVIPYQTYQQWNDGRIKPPEKIELKQSAKTPQEIQAEFGATLKRISSLGGSTGAWFAEDDNGKYWVVKQYLKTDMPEDHVANEYIASQLYQKLGISVPNSRLAIIDNKPAFVTEFLQNPSTLGEIEAKVKDMPASESKLMLDTIRKEVQKGFVADAWLANWDSVGLEDDNIVFVGSKGYRIDLGGSLLYRAQGSPKGMAFSESVKELETLRSSSVNPSAAKWFKNIPDQEIISQIENIENRITYKTIEDIVLQSGLTNGEDKIEIIKTLSARLSYLSSYKADLQKKIAAIAGEAKKIEEAAIAGPKLKKTERKIAKNAVTGFYKSDQPILSVKVNGESHQFDDELFNIYRKMSPEEQKIIKNFTFSSSEINKLALEGNPNENLVDAIKKLPRVDCNLWRSITTKNVFGESTGVFDPEKFINGSYEEMRWKAFSSTTINRNSFGYSSDVHFLIINDGTNLDAGFVGGLSEYPNEQEVIVNANARFKVIGYAEKSITKNNKTLKDYIFLLRPKNPAEPSGISQNPIKKYEYNELLKIFDENIKIWE